MRALALVILLGLAACGADGAPEPRADARQPGIGVSGEARIGIVGSL